MLGACDRLARLCGGVITGKNYVGYVRNEHGGKNSSSPVEAGEGT